MLKAAEHGELAAQSSIASSYENGIGVAPDLQAAARWYRKAAEAGDAGAAFTLGFFYQTGKGVVADPSESLKWVRRAADGGTIEAQCLLGSYYLQGSELVPKDTSKAFNLFQSPAQHGLPRAQFVLGLCYLNGQGTSTNQEQALLWINRAAQSNFSDAQTELGNCYAAGKGVKKDVVEAGKWFMVAREQEAQPATELLDILKKEESLTPEQLEEAKKRATAFIADKKLEQADAPHFTNHFTISPH